jgi:hypothetical protein
MDDAAQTGAKGVQQGQRKARHQPQQE